MDNRIKLFNVIGSDSAETPEIGDIAYHKIVKSLDECIKQDSKLTIDFENINNVTSAFLNNAIGKLFFKYDWNKLINVLVFTGFSNIEQINTLKFTLTNAKLVSKSNTRTIDI